MQSLHRPVPESLSMNYARPEPIASRLLAEEAALAPDGRADLSLSGLACRH